MDSIASFSMRVKDIYPQAEMWYDEERDKKATRWRQEGIEGGADNLILYMTRGLGHK